MRKKVFNIIVLAVWLVMLGLLIERAYLRPQIVIALDAASEEGLRASDEWFGIYQQGRKIGYAHTQVFPEDETYRLVEESEMDILALGQVQTVSTRITCYTTRNFQLKYFDFLLSSGLTDMKIKGAVLKNQLVLDITTAGQTRTERVPLAKPPYLAPA